MKNFFKKVAFVLALAMVLTNIGPAVKASAAEAPGLKYTSRVIYVGGSAFGDYTDNCWTPSKNAEGYTVTYSTNSTIIDVAKNGKITANGTGIGAAVVNVTYSKAGEANVTARFTVKVRRNASDVILTKATVTQIEEALKIGDVVELNAAKSFVGTSYKTGNYGLNNYMKAVSDQITYKSSNEEVFKVEGSKLTAVGNGTATLTVVAYEYGDKTQTPVVYKDYTVTVLGGMLSVVQKATNKLEVVMGNTEGVKASDFVVTRVASKANIAIKEIGIDGNKVTITTFAEMKDGAEYAIAYDGKELTFVATDNKVNEITVNTTTVEYNNPTEIIAYLVDVNGVILDTINALSTRSNVTFSIETNEGYMSAEKLVLFEIGNSAKLTVTYRTGEYDSTTGAEIGTIERTFAIVAVAAAPVTAGASKYVIKDAGEPDWDSLTSSASICVEEPNRFMYIYRKDSKDNDLTKDYTFESSNNDVLIVSNYSTYNGKGMCLSIVAIKTGSAFVLIKKDGTVVETIPVVINAKRAYNTFTLTKTSVTVSNSLNIGSDANDTVELKGKDQYGVDWTDGISSGTPDYSIDALTTAADNVKAQLLYLNDAGKIIVTPVYTENNVRKSVAAGTYQYKVTKGNVSRVLTVVVQAPGTSESFKLIITNNNIDVACENKDNGSEDITVKIGIYRGGVLDGYADFAKNIKNEYIASITKGSDVKTDSIAARTDGVAGDVMTMHARTVSGGLVEKAAAGSYVVSATVSGTSIKLTGGFAVQDTQKAMTYKLENPTVSYNEGDGSPAAIVLKAFDFYYNGGKIEDESRITVTKVDTPNVSDWNVGHKGNVAITKVYLEYVIDTTPDNVRIVKFEVAIGRTITVE